MRQQTIRMGITAEGLTNIIHLVEQRKGRAEAIIAFVESTGLSTDQARDFLDGKMVFRGSTKEGMYLVDKVKARSDESLDHLFNPEREA